MSSSDSSSWHPYFVFWTYFSKTLPSSRLNETSFICDFGSQEELAIVPDPSSLASPSSSLHEACVTLSRNGARFIITFHKQCIDINTVLLAIHLTTFHCCTVTLRQRICANERRHLSLPIQSLSIRFVR